MGNLHWVQNGIMNMIAFYGGLSVHVFVDRNAFPCRWHCLHLKLYWSWSNGHPLYLVVVKHAFGMLSQLDPLHVSYCFDYIKIGT